MSLNIEALLPSALKIATLIFFPLMCYYHMQTGAGAGDEWLFLSDLNYIKTAGWTAAIEKNIGLTYLLFAYPLSLIFQDYMALRLVNILLWAGFYFYCWRWGAIKNNLYYFYVTFVSTFGFFLLGTNDTLFIVAMFIFFNEAYKQIEDKENPSTPLMWCALILAFFTRELIYIYIPLVLLSVFLIAKKKVNLLHKWYIPTALFMILIVVNLPCIEKNHRLSYDDKKPPVGVISTWPQRQYLAQLLVNNGTIANNTHPSWQETDAYLKLYGKNSLPKTTGAGIFFDYKLTLIEFFKDFASSIVLSVRQTGLILIFVFSFLLLAMVKRKITTNLLLPFASLFIVGVFSFIIISYVETRWLLVAYLLAVLYYSDLEIDKKIPKRLLQINHLVLILVMLYGSYKVVLKL